MRAVLCARTFGLTPGAGGATALGDLEDAVADGAGALADPLAEPPQRAREDAHSVRPQRGVRRLVNVGFDDGRIDAEAPPSDDPALPPARHPLGQQILED